MYAKFTYDTLEEEEIMKNVTLQQHARLASTTAELNSSVF
jgi:hypothetical protein